MCHIIHIVHCENVLSNQLPNYQLNLAKVCLKPLYVTILPITIGITKKGQCPYDWASHFNLKREIITMKLLNTGGHPLPSPQPIAEDPPSPS